MRGTVVVWNSSILASSIQNSNIPAVGFPSIKKLILRCQSSHLVQWNVGDWSVFRQNELGFIWRSLILYIHSTHLYTLISHNFSTLYNVCTFYICSTYTLHYTYSIYPITHTLYTLDSTLNTLKSTLYYLHSTLYTPLYTICSILYIYSTLK